jgi:hypothetical protein
MRARAHKLMRTACEHCAATTRLHVHHLDENPRNNRPSNLMTLCARCHRRWHWTHGRERLKRGSVCRICPAPSKGLGYCLKHYQRFRKYGDPYLSKRGGRLVNVSADDAAGKSLRPLRHENPAAWDACAPTGIR